MKTTCPYVVGAARDIWMEGFRAGVRMGAERTGAKRRKIPQDSQIEVTIRERDHAIDVISAAVNDTLPKDRLFGKLINRRWRHVCR